MYGSCQPKLYPIPALHCAEGCVYANAAVLMEMVSAMIWFPVPYTRTALCCCADANAVC